LPFERGFLFFIKFLCVFFLELIMQRAYGLVSRQMSPMSYMVYSIQHYILLCKMKFDNDLRHLSNLSLVLYIFASLIWLMHYLESNQFVVFAQKKIIYIPIVKQFTVVVANLNLRSLQNICFFVDRKSKMAIITGQS
jgi:hypothetical protein